MNIPFYAENSIFQLLTAVAYLLAASLFLSSKRRLWEFVGAGIICAYIAFDEYFMFHECLRLSFPYVKQMVQGDFTILFLSLLGVFAALWGIFKLSRNNFEKILYTIAGVLCSLEIYLDVFSKTLFYLELDIKIEEISELVLALVLIILPILGGIHKRFILIFLILGGVFYFFETSIHNYIWTACPKLKVFKW